MPALPCARLRCLTLLRACLLGLAAAIGEASGGPNGDPESSGISFQAVYKADLMQGLSQRIDRRRQFLGNVDLKLAWQGRRRDADSTRALLHLLNNHGDKPNESIGTAQGVTNLETPANSSKIYQAWIEQGWFDDQLALLIGLFDLNSEFYVTESSALFVHPAFGTGAELGQTGRNGPSIFPTTSLAVRARAKLGRGYLQAALFDGVPGSLDNPRGTHVRFDKGDGALQIVEAGVGLERGRLPGKLALGAWRYTARFADLTDVDTSGAPIRRRNRGVYLLCDYPLLAVDAGRGLNAFLRAGTADPDINRFSYAVDAGVTLRGPLGGRPDDAIGIGFAYERNSRKSRELAIAAGQLPIRNELSIEIDYRAQLRRWLVLQPNLQHLQHHGGGAGAIGWLAGLRLEVTLP